MEIWNLYDENRHLLPHTHVRGVPLPPNTYHLVTDVWTVNYHGEILITQRHPSKKHGGLWECNGGAALIGETSLMSAQRELHEETGIFVPVEELILLHSVKTIERFVDTYITYQNIDMSAITIQTEEVINAQFVSFDELVTMWENGLIVPRERFRQYCQDIESFVKTNKGAASQ